MKTNPLFDPGPQAVEELVRAFPFAFLITGAPTPLATPLPLVWEKQPDNAVSFVGHLARGNAQVGRLREDPRALIVFLGRHGYISPSWFRDRTQAPTWNYEMVQFEVQVSFCDGDAETRRALESLLEVVERGRSKEWSIEDMGGRYEKLARAIIPFRARITATFPKFKLGQNERSDVLEDMLAGLEQNSQQSLAAAIRRSNQARMQAVPVVHE